jgi:hypothetical protein
MSGGNHAIYQQQTPTLYTSVVGVCCDFDWVVQ